MAQKPDVRVVKEALGWLDGDVILKEDLKKDAQLFKQIKKGPCSTNNVIYVGPGSGTYFSQNVIYFSLDVGHRVNISHDRNLEGLLASMSDYSKHKAMVWIKKPLMKKKSSI